MARGERGQGRDVIDDAMRKVGRAAHEENGVRIDEAPHGSDVDFVRRSRTCDEVDADLEVFASFQEGGVCCVWDDPVSV